MQAAGVQIFAAGDFGRYVRVRWTLTAGAEVTFAVTGTALETFCTLAELLELGAAGAAVGALPKATRIRHLTAATQVARGYLSRRFAEPFLRVGRDVAQAVAKIASLSLLTDVHGINPHTEATALAVQAAEGRERWLRDVSRGVAGADVTDSTPETSEGSGAVVTGTSRGWGSMTVL
jgi:phage gp36-like protein